MLNRQAFEIVMQVNGVANDWHARNTITTLCGFDEKLAQVVAVKGSYEKEVLLVKLIVEMRHYKAWAHKMRRMVTISNYGKVVKMRNLAPIPVWLKLSRVDHPDNVGKGYTREEVKQKLRQQGVLV